MFERRLKTLIALLIGVAAVLLLRAAHVQIVNAAHWRERAAENMRRTQLLPTIRGSILDRHGRELAVDEPCIDAAVDYRAIVRDPEWMREQLRQRVRANPGYRNADKAGRARISDEENARLKADLDQMWRTLAQVAVPPKTLDEIELTKASIRRQVEMRRRYLWYANFSRAMRSHEGRDAAPWYKEWLLSEEPAPQLDSFAVEVAEQAEAHVVLPAVSPEVHNFLKKQIERFPGLVLRPSKHRTYPFGSVACHILGNLGIVAKEDMERDANAGDELRAYGFTDLIGRGGIEALADQALRGIRGRSIRELGKDGVLDYLEPVRGRDVRISIDAELQAQLEHAFTSVEFKHKDGYIEKHEMHGAAVVLDVASGQILALASYPTYDLNRFDELYKTLAADRLNTPLLNRATQLVLEPGSTVKPVVGLSAIGQGLIGPEGTIECTGYLIIDGEQKRFGKCWVVKRCQEHGLSDVAHHPIPSQDPHPTGFLTFSDALQRSCNVYFETLGDKLGLEGLSLWYDRFGLGRRTNIGIPESAGRLPISFEGSAGERRGAAWFSAIGQSQILATPLQMANVAATIARDGVWVRPKLLADRNDAIASTRPAEPDRVDLHLPRTAVAAAKEGMIRVVNSRAGSAWDLRRKELLIAGKTGTAQAAAFALARVGPDGKPERDVNGRIVYERPAVSTREDPNPRMPWYRGSGASGMDLSHAWFIGFAPARNPTVAFAVMLEYGGSGGHDAAPIVNAVLDACIEHGYLAAENQGTAVPMAGRTPAGHDRTRNP